MKKEKQKYETPTTNTVEVKMNGVLCESAQVISILLLDQTTTDLGSFGDNWEWN